MNGYKLTLETDKASFVALIDSNESPDIRLVQVEVVDVEFARSLERERNKLKDEVRDLEFELQEWKYRE